jgi:hypothetical protein
MARRHEWNPLADEDWNDMDVELIDLAGVQERGDQLSAAHHPDLFAGRRAQTLRNAFTGSDMNSTPGAALFGGFRENT